MVTSRDLYLQRPDMACLRGCRKWIANVTVVQIEVTIKEISLQRRTTTSQPREKYDLGKAEVDSAPRFVAVFVAWLSQNMTCNRRRRPLHF